MHDTNYPTQLICSFAPTKTSPAATRNKFYSQLETVTTSNSWLLGDFNARVGRRLSGDSDVFDSVPSKTVGPWSLKNDITPNANGFNFIVREIHKYLQFYNTFSNVSIIWCKGHSNILGNEVADYFARQSVLRDKQNNTFKRPLSHLKLAFKKITEHSWTERWQNSDNARNTFSFIPSFPAPKHFTQKEHHHKLTQILTGHCRLKMYLNYIGVEPDPACSCGEYVETVDHYIFHCKLEHLNRTNTLIKSCFEQGISFPPSREILFNNKYLFYSLCSFLTSCSRLDFDK